MLLVLSIMSQVKSMYFKFVAINNKNTGPNCRAV